MKERLFRLLGIEPEEESMVSMLLTQSVFLGIFLGAFDISAHSLFLSIFDEKAMAKAYVVSGLAGIILTASYTWLQARLQFRNFATGNLIFITFLTLLLWLSILLYPVKLVVFAVFVMMGPLNILAMLGFWGTTGRLFTLRQGKRLFGLVDAGIVAGAIVSCYAIPVLLTFNFKSHNILLISTMSIFAAAIIQILIGRKFTFTVTGTPKRDKKPGLSVFRKDSYIRVMGTFVALSVMTAFFVQYSFMAVTRLQYPLEEDMARFLGLFTGSMMIFTLLIKLLVFSYLIRNYGLKTCLAISPILIAGFTALAIIIGMTMGYTPASLSGFVIFFLIMALSRLFSKSLKDSIESPSFKVIYQTVDEKIRYEVQSGIDGTINEISALTSGLLLAGLGALSFVSLIHFSWVLFIIIAAWIFVSFRLYVEYRKSIRMSLEAVNPDQSAATGANSWETHSGRLSGSVHFRNSYYSMLNGDLTPIDRCSNDWFFRCLIDQAEMKQDLCMEPALKKIAARKDLDETIRQRAAEVIDQLGDTGGDPRRLRKQIRSVAEDEKIILARRTLADSRLPQTTEILRLLRDNNAESKRYAIYMIGKFHLSDMIPEVSNCLAVPGLESDAMTILESFGNQAYNELFKTYLGTSGNLKISKYIIRLIGRSCSKENTEFLFARLWSNSRRLKEIAADQLISCSYKASEAEKDKLHQLVSEIIGMITWNISAQVCLAKAGDENLSAVIMKETALWNTFLFNILSIAYDHTSLEKIRANIESGTVGSINYALEMIDIVIDESIKSKLVSVIDAVPDEEKLKNLHQFYPGEIPQYDRLIEDIINRDYNLVNVWTKACALRLMDRISDDNTRESVVALLFSPEKILREEAARLIGRTDRQLFSSVSGRLSAESAESLTRITSGETAEADFLFEKARFLAGVFHGIPEDELLFLAESMIRITDSGSPAMADRRDYIAWKIIPGKPGSITSLILNGSPVYDDSKQDTAEESESYILQLDILDGFRNMFPERSFELYGQIERYLETNKTVQ